MRFERDAASLPDASPAPPLLIFSMCWLLALIAAAQGAAFVWSMAGVMLLFAIAKKSRLWTCCLSGFFLGWFQLAYLHRLPPTPASETCIWQVRVESIATVDEDLLTVPRAKVLAGWARDGSTCGETLVGQRVRLGFSGVARQWAAVSDFVPGRQVRFQGVFHEPRGFHNPGSDDPKKFYAKQGLIGKIQASKTPVLFLNSWAKPITVAFANILGFRFRLNDYLHTLLGDREAGLVSALILGEQKWLDDESQKIFSITGCAHIFAASGFNVALVLIFTDAFFYSVLRRHRWLNAHISPRLAAGILSLPFLLGYIVLTGCADASVRAALMAGCVLLGRIQERKAAVFNVLGACLGVDLLFQPWKIWSISWQLSYASTLMILLSNACFPKFLTWVKNRQGLLAYTSSTLWVTAWALLGSAPFLIAYFKIFSLWGLLTNLVVLPLVSFVVLPLALISLIFWGWADSFFTLLIHVCGFLLSLTEIGLAKLTKWPQLSWCEVQWPWQGYFAFLFGLLMVMGFRQKRLVGVCALVVGLLGFDGYLALPAPTEGPGQRYLVTFLDVGHGDAAVIETPDQKVILVDAGGSPFSRRSQNILLPFFRFRKIKHIDCIFLSHAHPDHFGGLPDVFEKMSVGEFVFNGEGHFTLRDILESAQRHGTQVSQIRESFQIKKIGMTSFHLFNFFLEGNHEDDWSKMNNRSLVVLAKLGAQQFLFTGDIEKTAEEALVAQWSMRNMPFVDVLKVPHHGSRTSSSIALLRALRPHLAVVSSGLGMKVEFPHPEIIKRYQVFNVPLLETKACGAIRLKSTFAGPLKIESELPCLALQEKAFLKKRNEMRSAATLPIER